MKKTDIGVVAFMYAVCAFFYAYSSKLTAESKTYPMFTIALLFALLSYHPTPFCILDEIDAPLDDANIERFARFLEGYAQQTQFIVITHRKGTMEAANVMCGVTMEESGVSKILSVKMSDKLPGVE